MSLDDDIALTAVDDGRFRCDVSPNHWLEAGPNGGYIAALLAHAGDAQVADPLRQMRGLTVHYLRRPEAAPALIVVATMQRGRSVTFQRIDMIQDERVVATATGSWATPRDGIDYASWEMPDAKPPEECVPMTAVREGGPMPIHQQWEVRSVTGVGFGQGETAEFSWWVRPPEHRPLDAPLIAAVADALPPPIFAVAMPAMGVPTLDLTVHVRAQLDEATWDPGDWILCRFQTRLSADGFVEEDGELWTADGTLLANSRQLAISI